MTFPSSPFRKHALSFNPQNGKGLFFLGFLVFCGFLFSRILNGMAWHRINQQNGVRPFREGHLICVGEAGWVITSLQDFWFWPKPHGNACYAG